LVFYFHCRHKHSIFSTSEAEELVEVIVCLFLDHQLHGLALLLYECLQSLISYFTDKEWKTSCNEIGKSLACRFLTRTWLFWIYIYVLWLNMVPFGLAIIIFVLLYKGIDLSLMIFCSIYSCCIVTICWLDAYPSLILYLFNFARFSHW
jgi:hypothetical protein